ncbi:MAG TPA: 2-phosphosulfolactate phosphatase [Herpetosiphonaceae bacterium]
MHVEVACLPRDATRLPERVALVIDVIRATTTIVTMFERGARSVRLASDVLSARAAVRQHVSTLLVGEVGGLHPPDFAYGNSPVALIDADLRQHDLIFSTTNGTRALVAAAEAVAVIAACLRNGRAAVATALDLAGEQQADISIICAGRAGGTQQGLDDLICAGYLVEQIITQAGGTIAAWQPDADFAATVQRTALEPNSVELDDSARIARHLYHKSVRHPQRPREEEIAAAFRETGAAQGLTRLGLAEDVGFCAQIDVSEVVPRLARPGELTPYPLSILAAGVAP